MKANEPCPESAMVEMGRRLRLVLFYNQPSTHAKHTRTSHILAILLVAASVAQSSAQSVYETVTLFSDPNGGSCTLVDDKEAPLNVYVIHKSIGTVSSRFRVASSEGFNADYVSEVIHLPFHLGELRTGIEVVYAYCYTGTLLLATITYMGHGASSPCAYLEVLPHPQSYFGSIEVMNCSFDWMRASTLGRLLVNPGSGQCTPWCVVGVQSSTWGGVKALYR